MTPVMERALASSSRAAVVFLALCCAAARPLPLGRPQEAVPYEMALALPPAAGQRRSASGYGDAAARAGKWLPPYEGGFPYHHHHLPSAFWAHKPMPWFGARGGGTSAFEGAANVEEELVRLRGRERSYENERTKQEQLAMWASLLNPKGKRRGEASGWLPGDGIGEAAGQEPATTKTSEGTGVEDPAVGGGLQVDQTNPEFYWRNHGS
jgi:hypothetical protein